jgi:RHS repeat-associated protein
VAEYSTQQSATPQVSYLTQDHLGSPRIITDNTGKIIARKDFNAFGDETSSAQRTELLGYKPEEVRQDYTGYQKDDESGLEFAQARYYNTKHGRFTSVDPLTASANVKDPQTFNRYSYAMNSPYKFTDPLGLAARPRQSSLVDAGAIASDARTAPARGTDPIVTGGRANSTPASAQQSVDQNATPAVNAHEAAHLQQENNEGLIRIPGLEPPAFSFSYGGQPDGHNNDGTTPLSSTPEIALPLTSAAVNAFVTAISPYVETTAVLNTVEAVTGLSVDSISSTMMGQISATISKTLSATPSVTGGATATGSYSQTTTEKGATTLTARTELSAKIVALTIEHQASIKVALAADRAANKMSVLSEKTLLNHVTSVMRDGTTSLDNQIRPRMDAIKTVLTDVLKK